MASKTLKIGIGFSPYGRTYGRYGDDKFAQLKAHGYDAADYNISDTDTPLYALGEGALVTQIRAERQAAQQAGVAISQTHGPWRWPPQDGTREDRAERMEKMKRAVQITALLGCDHLVIHPLMPCGVEDLLCGKEQETWDVNVAFFRELADFSAPHRVTICLENMPMPHFSVSTPQRILALAKAIGRDNVKICLDTGHVAVFPTLSVGDEVRRLGRAIRVLHVHDNDGHSDSHDTPGTGVVDWTDFFRALDEIGFDGVLSLETSPSGASDDRRFAEESRLLNRRLRQLAEDA